MIVRSFIGLVALLLLAAGPVTAQPRFDFERTATLLPKTVLPFRVQLRLDLDPAKPTFSGDVTITLRVRKPVPAIVLHARDLQAVDYAFAIEHWQALARLAGDGAFGGSSWLLPGIVWWPSDPQMAQRLLQDQQRLAGATGASTAERVAAGIQIRSRLREREASALAAALATVSTPH